MSSEYWVVRRGDKVFKVFKVLKVFKDDRDSVASLSSQLDKPD